MICECECALAPWWFPIAAIAPFAVVLLTYVVHDIYRNIKDGW